MKDSKEKRFEEQKNKHPMRCETCAKEECDFYKLLRDEHRKIIESLPVVAAIQEFVLKFGCASHSSNESPVVSNSTQLITMAHQEWKNREERKQNAPNERDWCSGWMDGFLSVEKLDWSKEHDRAIEQAAREKVLEELVSVLKSGNNVNLDCDTTDEWYGYGWEDCRDNLKTFIESLIVATNQEQNK